MLRLRSAGAQAWHQHIYDLLIPSIKDPCECQAITRRLLAHYLDYDLTKHVTDTVLDADESIQKAIEVAITRLHNQEPIQYILGETTFLTHTLHLSPDVLIPRPETEEMVQAILDANTWTHKHVLDLCTGSGCIAIAIKKAIPTAIVHALDISEKALAIAQKNAEKLGATITWHQMDILAEGLPPMQWDLIVSNPPYVPAGEKAHMASRVVDYEPSLALFVPDQKPFLFYEKIASLGTRHLRENGQVYLECHHDSADQVRDIFRREGFQDVRIAHDTQGKERWLIASAPDSSFYGE